MRVNIHWSRLACLTLVLGATLAGGCGGNEEAEQAAAAEQARAEEIQALEQRKEELDAQRQRLAELRDMQAQGEPAEGEATEASMTGEEVDAEIAQLEQQIEQEAEALYNDVVTFFNAEPPLEGEPLTDVQERAIAIKSDEDIRLAEEYVVEGGNYERAIQIYRDALVLDPDNARLQELMAEAEGARYMSEERFSQVEKGMTTDQVRSVLGTALPVNRREYEQEGRTVTAWFYPKSPAKDAAAVYFRPQGGSLEVYLTDFDAVEPKGAGEEEE